MNNKFGLKKTLLSILGILGLATISIFVVFIFYRTSINPNPDKSKNYKKESIKEIEEQKYYLYIDNYEQEKSDSNILSVFETNAKLQEALNNSNKEIFFKGNLEFTEELQEKYKLEILDALYFKNFKKAFDYANEVIYNYNLNDEKFKLYEVFLFEVLEFNNYDKKSFEEKKNLIKSLISPELILYSFLSLDMVEQSKILTYKESDVVFGNAYGSVNIVYNDNLEANVYTETRINDIYFVVPNNIEAFKILFKINDIDYSLHYIRYKDTNDIELLRTFNLNEDSAVSYKVYIDMYSK